jgi:hypothetical protein
MDLIMEQFELDMDILQSKYERVNEDLEFLIRKCDMKYIAESGTEDDLTALYTEANEQANEKKKNIFQKMIERIKAFIQKIISKIKGKEKKINKETEYKLYLYEQELAEAKQIISELKIAVAKQDEKSVEKVKEKSSDWKNNIRQIKNGLIVKAGLVVGGIVVYKVVSGVIIPVLNQCITLAEGWKQTDDDAVNKWAAETASNVASGVNDIQDVIYKDISGYKDEEGNFHTVEILNSK